MILIYRLIINLIIIISPIIILIRLIKKKEDPIRFKEKYCLFSKKRGKGKLIWFHGASVGELLSAVPLIEKLEKNKKIDKILVTSSTLSSSKVFLKFKLKKTIHQFFPIDSEYLIKKFLLYWKPSLVIFIDSEIWPNLILNLKKKFIPHVLLNARITKRSYDKWKFIPSLSKPLFESFTVAFPQNYESNKYLKSLGVKKIKNLGNLKFSENKITNEKPLKENFINFLKNKKIWCASSTHNSEELICAKAHIKLKKKYKNLITIIIPRHVQRKNQIIDTVENLDLKIHCHSSSKNIDNNTDIYLVDTYGETKSFFKIIKIIFLGGSLINHGGQNPLEAARFGCKILHGPNVANFKEVYNLLKHNKQSFKINNLQQLIFNIDKLIKKNENSNILRNRINKLGKEILKSTSKEINFLIN
jgi:3-deoxy-D-manno-octulosonic-acid transferase